MSLALLFPGQGTQHPQMLAWVDGCATAAPTLDGMTVALGADWRQRLGDAAWASGNAVAQTLLTGLCTAAWQALAPRLPAPAVVAGYSVGELPAFAAAGVFGAAEAQVLAGHRAAAMARSVAGQDTGLMAVGGIDDTAVSPVCARHGLAVAIVLDPDRRLLGGPQAALRAAQAEFEALGAHVTPLPIAVASHTPWMAAAVGEFAAVLEPLEFAPPSAVLVCNFSGGAVRGAAALKAALAGQLAATVPWPACMDAVAERLPKCVLEVGPGDTLSRLWNGAHPGIPARSADEFRSADAVAAWVLSTLARA